MPQIITDTLHDTIYERFRHELQETLELRRYLFTYGSDDTEEWQTVDFCEMELNRILAILDRVVIPDFIPSSQNNLHMKLYRVTEIATNRQELWMVPSSAGAPAVTLGFTIEPLPHEQP